MSGAIDLSVANGISSETFAESFSLDNNLTLVLDCRPFMAYNEIHITTASNVHCPPILKRRSNGFVALENIVPCETRRKLLQNGHYRNVVVYDADTSDLTMSSKDSNLYSVLKSLRQQVDINDVTFVIGGFQDFFSKYPHLCEGQNSNTIPCKLQGQRQHGSKCGPVEIFPGLYIGDSHHASRLDDLRNLGITALLNVSTTCKNLFESDFLYMTIPVNDTDSADLSCWFAEAIHFIESVLDNGGRVLVHCHAGVSRSATICIAFLMHKKHLDLEKAYDHIKEKRSVISPNFNFMKQLQDFEKELDSINLLNDLPESVAKLQTVDRVKFDFSVVSSSPADQSREAFDFSFPSSTLATPTPFTPLVSPS